MGKVKLLNIEPQALTFRFELNKQASCTIRLSSNSRNHVAFKVKTTNPKKYLIEPNIGILSPGSFCDVKVTVLHPEEGPPEMHCLDKFQVSSVIASAGATAEDTQKLFSTGCAFEACKLRVACIHPSYSQPLNSERSQLSYSNLDDSQGMQQQDRNRFHFSNPFSNRFVKGITIGLVVLIISYLMLPHIWSFGFMIVILVIKMINKLVSESVEDWAVKTLLCLCTRFMPVTLRHFLCVVDRVRRHIGTAASALDRIEVVAPRLCPWHIVQMRPFTDTVMPGLTLDFGLLLMLV